jgi:hypothetical protein
MVAVEVLGWEITLPGADPAGWPPGADVGPVAVFHFSTRRHTAALVERRMFDNGYQCCTNGCIHTKDAPWHASFAKGPNTYHGNAKTVEHAICLAALKAKRASQ